MTWRRPLLLLLLAATAGAVLLAGCGGGDGGSSDGLDTGLGFSVEVDEKASPQQQLHEYASALFDQVQLDQELEKCALANADKADPAELTRISGLPEDEQPAARQKFQASLFEGCSLEAGGILEEGADEASGRLVAYTLRENLKAALGARGDEYAKCVGENLDEISDDDLLKALVTDPEQSQELGSQIAEDCGDAG